MRTCVALMIAAPASGQGKTKVIAALARWFHNQGHCVRVFKTGPDYLNPMILEYASYHPVYQLDLWMGGESHYRQLLYEAAETADIITGHHGNGEPVYCINKLTASYLYFYFPSNPATCARLFSGSTS